MAKEQEGRGGKKSELRAQLFDELSNVMEHKFDKRIGRLVDILVEMRNTRAHQLLGVLQTPLSDERVKSKWRDVVKLLILTENNLINSLDTHPFGIHLSIFLYSEAAQRVLNVKHLLQESDTTGSSLDSTERIVPKLDMTHLYSNSEFHWVRCQLAKSGDNYTDTCEKLENALLWEHPAISYSHFYLYPETNIVEFYFKKPGRRNCLSVLSFFNSHPLVRDIIFYSESKILKAVVTNEYLVLSNILKFIYCYTQGYLTLSVFKDNDWRSLFFIFTQALMFTHKDNLKSYNSEQMLNDDYFSPLSLVTGENPQRNLFKIASNLGLEESKFALRNDREYRLLGHGSLVGGRNKHEVVITRSLN